MTDDEMRELAKQLPFEQPDAARREAVRSSLLMAAAEREEPRSRRAWLGVAGGFAAGVAAAAAVLLLVRGGNEPVKQPAQVPQAPQTAMTSARATIEASNAANFEREVTTSSGGGIDEVVHLHGGKLRLAVGELASTEHVRVQAGTSTIEGSGDFEVAVAGDVLQSVTVGQGNVKVAMANQQAVFLSAGQTWKAPIETAVVDVPVTPAPIVASIPSTPDARPPTQDPRPSTQDARPSTQDAGPSPLPDQPPTPPSLPAPPAPPIDTHAQLQQHFQAGYASLRASHFDDAATELGLAADSSDSDPLAIDARYLQATALIQAHRPGEAEKALIAFIDRAPTSLRRGRAAVMLARLIADRGDAPAARKWFESALTDSDASVAAAAKAGLAALDRVH